MNYIELLPHNCSGVVSLKTTFENVLAVENFSCEFEGEILVVRIDEFLLKLRPQHKFMVLNSNSSGQFCLEYSLQPLEDSNGFTSLIDESTSASFRPFSAILSLLVNFRGEFAFVIDRLVILESRTVSVDCKIDAGTPVLHWRIGFLYHSNLTSLDLVVASTCFQGEFKALQALESFEISCKGCGSEIVTLQSRKLVPLPSSAFLEAREGISCEECHPGNFRGLNLVARDGWVYINDQELIVPLNGKLVGYDECRNCNLKLGAAKFGFLYLDKACIAVLNSDGDVFWRHCLHKQHLDVLSTCDQALELADATGRILKIIKGSRNKQAFVYFNFSIAQAWKVLCRKVRGHKCVDNGSECNDKVNFADCRNFGKSGAAIKGIEAFCKSFGESGAAKSGIEASRRDSSEKVVTQEDLNNFYSNSTAFIDHLNTILHLYAHPKESTSDWIASLIPY